MKHATGADQYLVSASQPRLRYRDEGEGPAVLLVHGWLLDLTMWDALAADLASRFRVIRWDRRGFGASDGTPDLGADSKDGVRLLEHLGIGRTAIVAWSQGCRIALNIVESALGRSTCLILDGAAPLEGLPDGQWRNETPVLEYRARLLDQGIDALRAELADHPLLQLTTADPAYQARLHAMLARYEGADLLALTPGVAPPVPADRFCRLHLPVLLLNGEHDTEQRLRVGEALLESIAGAERRIVPAARHIACWDNPAVYNGFVRDFLLKNNLPQ